MNSLRIRNVLGSRDGFCISGSLCGCKRCSGRDNLHSCVRFGICGCLRGRERVVLSLSSCECVVDSLCGSEEFCVSGSLRCCCRLLFGYTFGSCQRLRIRDGLRSCGGVCISLGLCRRKRLCVSSSLCSCDRLPVGSSLRSGGRFYVGEGLGSSKCDWACA